MTSFLKTLLFLIAGTAFAQPYPSKPIRVIVPFSPGGPVDVVMRLPSPKMTEMLGQPLVIENKTGAGGNLGVQQAARAPADGYTVLATSSSFAVNPALTPDAGYNPEKDFIAVAVVASQPNFILVNAAFPARPLGYPDMEDYTWVGLFLPAGTPAAIAQKLNDAVIRTVQSADIRERLDGLTFEATAAPLRETADYVKSELVKWAKVVRDTGAKAE